MPPTVIGQSQAAMAAWHDFLGQSSRIYRASTGVQGSRIWSLPSQGQPGLPQLHPLSATPVLPSLRTLQWAVDLVGRLLPLLLVIITISTNGQGEDGADRSLFCIWDPINSSCRLLTYLHPPHGPPVVSASQLPRVFQQALHSTA